MSTRSQSRRKARPLARECEGKSTYRSYKHAEKCAGWLCRRTGEQTEPYPCHHCHGWHVGHPDIEGKERLRKKMKVRDTDD